MKKKTILFLAVLLLASCATFQQTSNPPSFHLEGPQPVVLAQLTLEQRMAFEDGWSSLKRGNVGKAQKEFSRLGDKSPFFHLGEGYCRLYEQNLEGAKISLGKALEINPDLVSARVGLAVIYEKQNNEDKLFLELREILKKEPEHTWARPKYEELKNRKTQALIKEGQAFLNQNKKEEARQSFLKALFYSPNSIEAHSQLARTYRMEKKYSQAINHYQVTSSLAPKDKQILKEYAETLLENDDLSKSLDVYEKLRELSPGDRQVQEKIEFLKNQLGIVEIPSMYNEISKSKAISRQDLAAILAVKFSQYLPEPTSPPIIVDISTSWAAKFIIKMAAIPLMDIYDNHTFEPNRVVTRAEMAETFFRLINYLNGKGKKLIPQIPTGKIQISDLPEDNLYFLPAVQMVSYQLMELSAQKRFLPDSPVSGIEALRTADLLLNLIK